MFKYLLLLLLFPITAHAYIGPGMGVGALGVVIGFVLSIFLAILAIFWYPIKRLVKKFKKDDKATKDIKWYI